jgi:hypothetical protein
MTKTTIIKAVIGILAVTGAVLLFTDYMNIGQGLILCGASISGAMIMNRNRMKKAQEENI